MSRAGLHAGPGHQLFNLAKELHMHLWRESEVMPCVTVFRCQQYALASAWLHREGWSIYHCTNVSLTQRPHFLSTYSLTLPVCLLQLARKISAQLAEERQQREGKSLDEEL